MSTSSAILHGQCAPWPSVDGLARCLRDAGLRITQGRYSIRVADCAHFVFQHLGGDVAGPSIEADAGDVQTLIGDATRVSAALAAAGVRHRFEIYDDEGAQVGYLHHDWPEV